jgi:hypothetical protein
VFFTRAFSKVLGFFAPFVTSFQNGKFVWQVSQHLCITYKISSILLYIKKNIVKEISLKYKGRIFTIKIGAIWHFGAENTLYYIIIYKIDYMDYFT